MYLNHEDTNVLIVSYVTVQTHRFSIKMPTTVSESWRQYSPHCILCYCSDPRTQHKDTYVRMWIMKTHLSSLKLLLLFRPNDSTLRYLRPYLNHEDTNFIIVAYVIIQTQWLNIKTPTAVSESWRHQCPQCILCYCSDPWIQHKDTYARIWIMKTISPHCILCYCSDQRTQHKDTYVRIWIMKTQISSL